MFDSIVVAIDGSAHSRRALAAAIDVAARYRAKLAIVHVLLRGESPDAVRALAEVEHLDAPVEVKPVRTATIGIAFWPEYVSGDSLEQLGNALLENAAAQARAHGLTEVDATLADGDPARTIVKYAESSNTDLIVMGSRGLSNLQEILIGGVSSRIHVLAHCACLLVK